MSPLSRISLLSITFIFLLSMSGIKARADLPKAIQIAKNLHKNEVCDHNKFYNEMFRDTSVLKHPFLRHTLVKIAREIWFEKYIKGDVIGLNEGIKCDLQGGPIALENFTRLTSKLRGKDAFRIWIHIIPYSTVSSPPDEVFQYIKFRGEEFMQVLLPEVSYGASIAEMLRERKDKREENQGSIHHTRIRDDENWDNRKVFTDLSGLMYEVVRSNWDQFHPGMRLRIKKLAVKLALENRSDITGLKTFAVAFFLDRGLSKDRIGQFLRHPPEQPLEDEPDFEIPGDALKQRILQSVADQVRSNYPVWPPAKKTDGIYPFPKNKIKEKFKNRNWENHWNDQERWDREDQSETR